MSIYSISPTLSQISLKNSFRKGFFFLLLLFFFFCVCVFVFFFLFFFQILAKIEMTRNKNRLFGRHF